VNIPELIVDLETAYAEIARVDDYQLSIDVAMPGVIVGIPGSPGPPGTIGIDGLPGPPGGSTSIFRYRSETVTITGDPGAGKLSWDNASQIAATQLRLDDFDESGLDVTIGLSSLVATNELYLQEYGNSANWQNWTITSATDGAGYWSYGVELIDSGGTGTTNFADDLLLAVRVARPSPPTFPYVQPDEPPSAAPKGTLWVDTDDPTPAATKASVGLGNADNTSDANKPVSTAQQAALDLKYDKTKTLVPTTGTAYTLQLSDASKFVTTSNAAPVTLTIPPNSAVAFPIGSVVEGANIGAGQLALLGGAGVSLNTPAGLKVDQWCTWGVLKLANDSWLVFGKTKT
jgi:hypothetical protein